MNVLKFNLRTADVKSHRWSTSHYFSVERLSVVTFQILLFSTSMHFNIIQMIETVKPVTY